MSKPVIICDIDGTLAGIEHRLHFIQQDPKDWDGFFDACPEDEPIPKVIELVQRLEQTFRIIFFTGRPERVRLETTQWLKEHVTKGAITLKMRQNGDHQEDYRVKSNMFEGLMSSIGALVEIAFIIDDRPQVIRMWQEKGVPVLDVGKQEEF